MRTSFPIDPSQWPELWQAAHKVLEQTVVDTQLRAWIDPLEFVKTESSERGIKIYFKAANDFSADWVRRQYSDAMVSAFSQVTGAPCEIQLDAVGGSAGVPGSAAPMSYEPPTEVRNTSVSAAAGASGVVLAAGSRSTHSSPHAIDIGLDAKFTFDRFVVGSSNEFAHASAVAVAEQPGHRYNPLFLFSRPGLGKTHLLQAIGNFVLANNPNTRVLYLSAERFVNELIESIKGNSMTQFRRKYRESYDLLLFDDIQFIAGKDRSEEEFFHTFNVLQSLKRQVVLTSDRSPKEIEGLEERIRTRFECGLVADISPPEIETRIAILKAKAERGDIYLPDDVSNFLATHIKSNVRELEGVLVKLQAHASLTGAEISLEMAKHLLRIAIPEEGSHLTVEAILAAVSKHFQIKAQDFKSNSRSRSVAVPRQIAMYLIRKYAGLSYKEIGHYFGGKDHTTVLHSCAKIEGCLNTDPKILLSVEAIQNLL